jgi:hypothetical protein
MADVERGRQGVGESSVVGDNTGVGVGGVDMGL